MNGCDSGAQRVTAQKAAENGQGFWDKLCGGATRVFSSIVAYGQGVVYALGQDITSSASTVISTVQSVFNAFAGPQSPDIIDPNASPGLSDISDAGVDTRPDAFGGRETAMELGEQFGHKLSLALGILGILTGPYIATGSAFAGIAAAPATAGLSLVASVAGVAVGVTVAGVSVALVAEASSALLKNGPNTNTQLPNNFEPISNRVRNHIHTEHDAVEFAKQLPFLDEETILKKLKNKTFFNKE